MFHTRPGPSRFLPSHRNDMEWHVVPLSLSAELHTNGPKLSAPVAANVGPQTARPQGLICGLALRRGRAASPKGPAARQSPFCLGLASCLRGKTNPILRGLAQKANCLPPFPKALEWQKRRRRQAQTPGANIRVDLSGDEPSG